MKKKIAILTGAGMSAESGISTFRDNDGLWDRYDPKLVASIDSWADNKQIMLDFYNGLRLKLEHTKPNEGHRIIASLEKEHEVDVITQNIDNLHERAGSTKVLHLHGELTKVRPETGVYEEGFSEKEVFDIGYTEIHVGDKAPNGRQLRPHIVWFGEAVPKIDQAITIIENADILLIVGTSLQVYPAAGLYRYAKTEAPIYIIDPNEVKIREKRITHIKETASKGMEEFVRILQDMKK